MLENLQPEHHLYARGFRLWHEGKGTWTEICDMSLDQVDLQVLWLDALNEARSQGDDS